MKVLVLGITGQDGSYLAELLLKKGYEVHGMIRRSATGNKKNIERILKKITLHYGDLSDYSSLNDAVIKSNPDVIFNEADQDSAALSFETPIYNYDVTGVAVGRILEIIRKFNSNIKFFQPISSNIYAMSSPYAIAKKFALDLCTFYRKIHGLKISTCVFYNHISPRQSEDYLLTKVIRSLKRIKEKKQKYLYLGDTNIKLDVGWAPEFMEIISNSNCWEKSEDMVIGTGILYSVQELVEMACEIIGVDKNNVKKDFSLLRPAKNPDLKSSLRIATIHGRELIKKLYDSCQ